MRKSTVVPNVAMVGKAVANIAQSTLLDIPLDGIEGLFFRDLHFGVGPTGNLNDHVEDAIVLGNVVPWADGGLSNGRFEVGAVLWERSGKAG